MLCERIFLRNKAGSLIQGVLYCIVLYCIVLYCPVCEGKSTEGCHLRGASDKLALQGIYQFCTCQSFLLFCLMICLGSQRYAAPQVWPSDCTISCWFCSNSSRSAHVSLEVWLKCWGQNACTFNPSLQFKVPMSEIDQLWIGLFEETSASHQKFVHAALEHRSFRPSVMVFSFAVSCHALKEVQCHTDLGIKASTSLFGGKHVCLAFHLKLSCNLCYDIS